MFHSISGAHCFVCTILCYMAVCMFVLSEMWMCVSVSESVVSIVLIHSFTHTHTSICRHWTETANRLKCAYVTEWAQKSRIRKNETTFDVYVCMQRHYVFSRMTHTALRLIRHTATYIVRIHKHPSHLTDSIMWKRTPSPGGIPNAFPNDGMEWTKQTIYRENKSHLHVYIVYSIIITFIHDN